ncbi:MAG: hypothetical protein MHPSP_003341, partial [Paramarteilia canceri]
QCDDSEIKIQANPNGQGILKMKNPSKKFSKDFKFSYQNSYDESQLLQLVCMKPAQNKADDLGQLCKRITIGATEEVFESTLEKMSAFEADQKKNTVKELNNESKFSPSWKNKKNNTVLPQKMSLVSKMKDIRNKSTSKQTNFETTSTPIPRKFQAFPIQDRIIHTLALRPYKKAHLIARLTNEGITNEEKHKIESILSKVSYFKDGSQPDQCQLSLKDTFKKYVKPDWAGYSYAEQQMMLRNQNFKNSIDDKTLVENKQISINGSENKQISIYIIL